MKNLKQFVFCIFCALSTQTTFAQDATMPSSLRIGLIPNVSSNVLMANYAPLKNFLLDSGFKRVDLLSSANFKTFNEQTKQQQFDLIVTAPHMARLAQVDYKWEPLMALAPNIRAMLIARLDEKSTLELGQNSLIAYANPESLVAMIGNKWLAGKNFRINSDYTPITVPREDNIGNLISEGGARFGILSNAELRAVPERFQSKVKIVEVLAEIPNFVVLSNANFSRSQNLQLIQLLKDFADKNQFGEQFFKLSGFTSLKPVTDTQMKSLDAYLVQTRTVLSP